jgi:dTDP-glucose 4,6-dehydratase
MAGLRILVTGGCGFIGSCLVLRLVEEGHEVVNLDALTYAGVRASLARIEGAPNYRFVRGDVQSRERVLEALGEGVDRVFHLAAESHVDRSIQGAEAFVRTNVLGTEVLLEACRGRAGRIVHVSTDEVYGSVPEGRTDEQAPLAPANPYAASKAGADLLALAHAATHGLDLVVTRCSNNFGPRQLPEKLIPLAITRALEGRPVPLYGDGRQVRDWIHVEDHVDALLFVAEHAQAGQVVNVGVENTRTNRQVLEELFAHLGRGRFEHVADRLGHDRRYALDAGRLRGLGWSRAPRDLGDTVAWYLANEAWWRPLLERLPA